VPPIKYFKYTLKTAKGEIYRLNRRKLLTLVLARGHANDPPELAVEMGKIVESHFKANLGYG